MKTNMTRRGAFTLVEILVVVGIIALLAGIAFPVFSRVREAGRRATCTSNLKQLGLAFQLYLQDSAGRYPGSGAGIDLNGVNNWKNDGNWVKGDGFIAAIADDAAATPPVKAGDYIPGTKADVVNGAIYQYVKSESTYYCPSVPNGKDKGLSYSMNCALTALRSLRIRTPSEIVLLVDEDKANDGYFLAVDDGPAGSFYGEPPATPVQSNSTDALTRVHNGGGNMLFADGHVDFYTGQQLPIDVTPEGKANKWRDEGNPRFHDKSFGDFGSNKNPTAPVDYCNATKRD